MVEGFSIGSRGQRSPRTINSLFPAGRIYPALVWNILRALFPFLTARASGPLPSIRRCPAILRCAPWEDILHAPVQCTIFFEAWIYLTPRSTNVMWFILTCGAHEACMSTCCRFLLVFSWSAFLCKQVSQNLTASSCASDESDQGSYTGLVYKACTRGWVFLPVFVKIVGTKSVQAPIFNEDAFSGQFLSKS